MKDKAKIRALTLAVVRREDGRFLLHRGYDSTKKEYFYRALGGGIEFLETGDAALVREFQEELGAEVSIERFLGCLENIFVYEGRPGHEIVLAYSIRFKDPMLYSRSEMDIIENGRSVGTAVWRTLAEISAEGARFYPERMAEWLA